MESYIKAKKPAKFFQIILCLLYIFFTKSVTAQFKGGSDDGSNARLASSQSLGESIFFGGENDGGNFALTSAQSLGESIYTGNSNDGSNAISANSQILGESIFTGSSNDGSIVILAATQSLGESIYTGGSEDGNVIYLATASSLGESIFAGGNDDGNAFKLNSSSSLGESIFSGGNDDGSVFALNTTSLLGESIYSGGTEDGSTVGVASSQSLAENIFKGGEGMGFAISVKANTPLPVKLISFDAKWSNNDAHIFWLTSNEIEMSGYTLERSLNKTTFDSLYYIESQNAIYQTTYEYFDSDLLIKHPEQHQYYYRLKQTDINGKVDYSGIATLVNDKNNQFNIAIFPNPTSDEIHLNINGNNIENMEILLFSAEGKLIKKQKGSFQNSIKISELADGNYILEVLHNNEKVISQQITVLK